MGEAAGRFRPGSSHVQRALPDHQLILCASVGHIEKDDRVPVLEGLGLMVTGGNQPQEKHEGQSMGKAYSQNRINIRMKPSVRSTNTVGHRQYQSIPGPCY